MHPVNDGGLRRWQGRLAVRPSASILASSRFIDRRTRFRRSRVDSVSWLHGFFDRQFGNCRCQTVAVCPLLKTNLQTKRVFVAALSWPSSASILQPSHRCYSFRDRGQPQPPPLGEVQLMFDNNRGYRFDNNRGYRLKYIGGVFENGIGDGRGVEHMRTAGAAV